MLHLLLLRFVSNAFSLLERSSSLQTRTTNFTNFPIFNVISPSFYPLPFEKENCFPFQEKEKRNVNHVIAQSHHLSPIILHINKLTIEFDISSSLSACPIDQRNTHTHTYTCIHPHYQSWGASNSRDITGKAARSGKIRGLNFGRALSLARLVNQVARLFLAGFWKGKEGRGRLGERMQSLRSWSDR